jgi:hypothetical protein
LTGFAEPVLGWQLTLATALDALTGCNTVYAAGWVPQLSILKTSVPNNPLWQLTLIRGQDQVNVNDTDWLVFDGDHVAAIPEATVASDYVVAQR